MCGISGIAALTPVNMAAVQAMTDALEHRGPDGEGTWCSENGHVGFGHRRLAIIDVSDKGAQPMASNDGNLAITYNGEIYNYKELRAELQELGVQFRTHSDTEVILEAYRAWGTACLDRFNGMFALAIHDQQRQSLFLARDRFGEKPLLFAMSDGVFAFASEYKALLLLETVGSDVDDTLLMRFLVDPTDALDQRAQTAFLDIQEVRPAEALTVSLQDLSVTRRTYWTVAPEEAGTKAGTADEAAAQFRELLTDAVKLRLRSDVPVGSCLSGGLDSSAITCLAATLRGAGTPYHVFTGRFPGTDADEGAWADMVVERTGVLQHESFPDGEKLLACLADFIWYNDLPVDSASQFAQWSVFASAKENSVTVLLDGQGSDEILGGYEQYFAPYLKSLAPQSETRHTEEALIRARYAGALDMHDAAAKRRIPIGLKRFLGRIAGRGSSVLLGMQPDFAASLAFLERPEKEPQDLHAALRKDALNGFLTTLLRYGDRNSMAHSREVRLPFCDHRIIEFVTQQPAHILMGDAQTKRLLREAMRGILPEPLRTRWRKQGFQPPIAHWLKGPLGQSVRQTFHDPSFQSAPYWDAAWWRRAFERFESGEITLGATLWKGFVIHQWQHHFLDRIRAGRRYAPTMH